MATFTWVIETRTCTDAPWLVHAMGTEVSGLSLRGYTDSTHTAVRHAYSGPNMRLTVHEWAG